MLILFIVLAFMVINALMFFSKDPYYVRMESAGHDREAMAQALKIELETTLRRATAITEQAPYMISAGNYLHCRSLVKTIQANGGSAKMVRKRFWEKKAKYEEGPIHD